MAASVNGVFGKTPCFETKRVHIHYYYGIRSKNHNGDGLLGPNSIMVVYMDPLGEFVFYAPALLGLHQIKAEAVWVSFVSSASVADGELLRLGCACNVFRLALCCFRFRTSGLKP